MKYLMEVLTALQGVTDCARGYAKACEEVLRRHVMNKFDAAVSEAVEAANSTVSKWAASKDSGGLAWRTYRATCARQYGISSVVQSAPAANRLISGAFQGIKGFNDFNEGMPESSLRSEIHFTVEPRS